MVAFLNKVILWRKKKNLTPQNKESYHALLITQRTGKLEISQTHLIPRLKLPTSQTVHSPRASRGKVWRNQKGSQTKTQDLLPFQECRRGTAQFSNSKTQRDRIRDSSVLIPLEKCKLLLNCRSVCSRESFSQGQAPGWGLQSFRNLKKVLASYKENYFLSLARGTCGSSLTQGWCLLSRSVVDSSISDLTSPLI